MILEFSLKVPEAKAFQVNKGVWLTSFTKALGQYYVDPEPALKKMALSQ